MTTEARRRWTPIVAWVLMIAGDGMAVWRGYQAAWWYRRWQNDRVFDPSAAELSLLNAQVEWLYTLAALGVAACGVALFMRAQRQRRRVLAISDAAEADANRT
jgi:hypothetical protein